MKRILCSILTATTLSLAQEAPVVSQIPLHLNLIEHLSMNNETKELEVTDTTEIPHYEFYDSTYEQRIILATHSHSGVVVDLSYFTLEGDWIEDIHKANPPKSNYVSKKSFDPVTNMLHYSSASESGSGASTIKNEEKRSTYYSFHGQIDSVISHIAWSHGLTTYEIQQKSIYRYDKENPSKLLAITTHRDDTLFQESYTYNDSSDFTKITIEKVYTHGDSTWFDRLHPIIKYCRPNDTVTIQYRSVDGGKDSHDLRTYDEKGKLIEEINLNATTDKVHAKKTYSYNEDGNVLQFRLYKPNSTGELELLNEDNYDYSWEQLSVIEASPFDQKVSAGRFHMRKNSLLLEIPQLSGLAEIVIVDALGRVVSTCNVNKRHTELPLTFLSDGIYIATLRIENKRQQIFRFVK